MLTVRKKGNRSVTDNELNSSYITPSVFHPDVHHVVAAVRRAADSPHDTPTVIDDDFTL